ncbi:hypothetical protein KU6B_58610 (plasmid) [Mameliella alba]|nr:hypothetical protein KU6B_58610 [Mameliella alba]
MPEILRAERRAVVWLQSKLQGQDTGPWRGLASTAPKPAREGTCPLYLRSAHIRGKAKGVMRRHGRGNEDQAHGGLSYRRGKKMLAARGILAYRSDTGEYGSR